MIEISRREFGWGLAGFAALTFSFSHSIIGEHAADERDEAINMVHHSNYNQHHGGKNFAVTPHHMQMNHMHPGVGGGFNSNGYDGYIGERFDVHRSRGPSTGGVGFVPKGGDVSALT